MSKVIGAVLLVGFLIGLLVWNTPVARLGSGFIIGNGQFVVTYYNLVNEAEDIRVKFPNEDDIPAKRVYAGKMENLAILKLQETPKVKRQPLAIQAKKTGAKEKYVFTLGYPWTNTLEDRHTFIEGSLATLGENATGFLEVELKLDSIHSGSPLFNGNGEVMGMVISSNEIAAFDRGEDSVDLNLAVPATVVIDVLKKNKITDFAKSAAMLKNLGREAFIEAVRNNVVLIEAR